MADIKRYTDKIRHAIYGREVRGSLADGIEAINSDVIKNKTDVDNGVNEMRNFENRINQAENTRVSNENIRKAAENERINNENARKAAESTRQSHENTRVSNENNRVNAENTRSNNENARQHNETNRSNAENTRVNNENTRNQAESTRNNNENARKAAETSRVNAENTRSNNEKTRISNEEARKSNESNRTIKFTELDKQAQGLISDMKQIVGNIDNRFITRYAPRIKGVDFNTLTTGGFYAVVNHEAACTNMPVNSDGYLMVIPWSSGEWASQIFVNDVEGDMHIRTKTGSAATNWSEWAKVYDTRHKPTPAEIGAVNKNGDTITGTLNFNCAGNEIEIKSPSSTDQARGVVFKSQSNAITGMIGSLMNQGQVKKMFMGNTNSPWTGSNSFAVDTSGAYFNNRKLLSTDDIGAYSFNGRDLRCYDKRAMVGFNTPDGNKLLINYLNDFGGGTWCHGRFHIGTDDKFMDMGISERDIAIGHNKTGKWLQLGDDGLLRYDNKKVQLEPQQSPLWSGCLYMSDGQNITLSKSIDQCQNGIILVWGDFDAPSKQTYCNYTTFAIPKNSGINNSGNYLCGIPLNEESGWVIKSVRVRGNRIEGNSKDNISGWNDVVLYKVIEY